MKYAILGVGLSALVLGGAAHAESKPYTVVPMAQYEKSKGEFDVRHCIEKRVGDPLPGELTSKILKEVIKECTLSDKAMFGEQAFRQIPVGYLYPFTVRAFDHYSKQYKIKPSQAPPNKGCGKVFTPEFCSELNRA